jgi:CRP/FNR family nitrogen fixation transcriptional regulator
MGVHTKTSPKITSALAHSKRRFSLPTWAHILAAAPKAYRCDAEIFGQQEPADCLYKVVSGAVRTFSVLRDGRRHIAEFYLAGDFFGLETNSTHALSAEAICNSTILVIKRSVLAVLADHDKDIAGRLRDMTNGELGRTQAHVTLLIKTSSERVAHFLLEMADRSPDTSEIELPMSRQDIGDHLGLTVETVSRTLSKFDDAAVIGRPSFRHVTLLDRAALERIQRCERKA